MLDTVLKLCSLAGVSGRENAVRDYIISEALPHAECSVDNLGSVIVFKKGRKVPKNRVMVDAHIDEVGLIVTGADDDGFLSFAKVGGIDTRVILGRSVFVGDGGVSGVIGIKPVHLTDEDKKLDIPDADGLYIDIGAKSREQALESVNIGDTAYFDSDTVQFGNGFLKGRALDDRVGCAIMLEMIKSELEYDTWFSFSVQEEIGTRGACATAYTIAPDYAVAVETTTAADIAGVTGEKRVCILGEGPAVSFMDRSTIYPRELFDRALALADEKNIKAQVKTQVAGGNNAGAIHKSRGGVKAITVSVPCRYLHSPGCVISVDDMEQSYRLVCALAEDLANA